jgi:hypothetical protein
MIQSITAIQHPKSNGSRFSNVEHNSTYFQIPHVTYLFAPSKEKAKISTTYKGINMLGYNQSRPSNTPNQTDLGSPMLSTTQHIFKSRTALTCSLHQRKKQKSVKLPPITLKIGIVTLPCSRCVASPRIALPPSSSRSVAVQPPN